MAKTCLSMSLLVLCSAGAMRGEDIGWNAAGKGGAVAAGDSRSVAAGIRLLEHGGNAADAAAATLLALSVTDYGRFAIGGEVPLLIYDARSQQVKVLSGLGRGSTPTASPPCPKVLNG